MKVLNRGFISIMPTSLFIEWTINNSDEEQFFTKNPEPTIYLIEEDFWDDEKTIEKYFKKIMMKEFSSLCSYSEKFPQIKILEEFESYFSFSLGTLVYDLQKEKLESN